jgi:hypothetical protein
MIVGKSWKGHAVRTVPGLLLASCVVLAVASLLAWDATSATELPAWVPTAAGLELAVPIGLIAFVCLRAVSQRTGQRFSVLPVQLCSGVLLLLMAVAQFAFASQIGDPGAYSGEGAGLLGIDEDEESVLSPLFAATAGAVFAVLTLTGVGYVYCQAITAEDPSKWDKQPGELDAMGEIIKTQSH